MLYAYPGFGAFMHVLYCSMSKLKPCLWPVDVPTSLDLCSQQGVVKVVFRAISGKRRMRFEDSRMRSLMELWSMTREEVENTLHREKMRTAELGVLTAQRSEPVEIKSEAEVLASAEASEDAEIPDAHRARSFPCAATIAAMVHRVCFADDSVDESQETIAELAESIDYDSETWLCLTALLRNKFIEETEAEKGNA